MARDDRIFTHARLATLAPGQPGLGVIENGAILVRDGRIAFAGAAADMPQSEASGAAVVDCGGRWITPGLIDCHTHLVHAGNRAREFEMRLAGASYEEIARAGGGIVSSVTGLRAASEGDLVAETLPRLDALIAEGVTTVEIKSGYGLTVADELKMLRAARRLAEVRDVAVTTTYLGAHATPAEYKGRNDAFLREVVLPGLNAAHAEGLVDAVDGFCEGIAFSPDEMRLVFDAARELGLPVKLHADQLSNLHGAALAAEYGALSADHLEYTDEAGAAAMAAAGTVAVLLPGAFYFIRETRKPPVDLFRRHGVGIALATDSNPGTSPLTSLLLAMNMGATLFGLTVEECIAGVTREAARALGRLGDVGTLEAGKAADLAVWDIAEPAELVYRMGFNPLRARIRGGVDSTVIRSQGGIA
ncbi:MAG: imidazolonepropionase [Aquamicrobium sp.]|nr:imidazolonepropionase [Aquamicrobium sp.]